MVLGIDFWGGAGGLSKQSPPQAEIKACFVGVVWVEFLSPHSSTVKGMGVGIMHGLGRVYYVV